MRSRVNFANVGLGKERQGAAIVLCSLRKNVLITVAAAWLGGCVITAESSAETVSGKVALDALARGDYVTAETEAAQAVSLHPNDPYALIALALTYELTARPLQARDYYKIVEALNPDGTIVLNDGIERRLIDVARARLTALAPPAAAPRMIGPSGEQAWVNVMSRFQTLRHLVQTGLATEGEYAERRRVNAGALLPYSESPAAPGLDQPPPSYDTVAERLRAIGKSLEDKSMTASEHATERVTILDALLPLNPRERLPGIPGLDPLVAPAYLGHVQKLKAAGLISADEAARERAAAERVAGPASMPGRSQAMPPSSARGASTRVSAVHKPSPAVPHKASPAQATPHKAAPSVTTGGKHGVQIASYASEAKAREGWDVLRKRFHDLAGLHPDIIRVDLGAKGIFFRLRAGPVASAKAAQAVCSKLRAAGMSCNPVRL